MEEEYGWTIEREGNKNTENYDQSALPWRAIKAASWTPKNKRVSTREEAEAWAAEATASARRYWKARMSR